MTRKKPLLILRNIGVTLAIPAFTYLFFLIMTQAMGKSGFGVGADLQTIFYTTIYSGLISLAFVIGL